MTTLGTFMESINYQWLFVSDQPLLWGGPSPEWNYPGAGHALTDVSCPFRQQPVIWWDDEPGEVYSHINFDLQQDLPPPLMPWEASSCKSSVAFLLAPLFSRWKSCWLEAHWSDSLAWYTHWYLRTEEQGIIQDLPWQKTFFPALSRMFHLPPYLSEAQRKIERMQIG